VVCAVGVEVYIGSALGIAGLLLLTRNTQERTQLRDLVVRKPSRRLGSIKLKRGSAQCFFVLQSGRRDQFEVKLDGGLQQGTG